MLKGFFMPSLGKTFPCKMYRAVKQSEYCNCWFKRLGFFKFSSGLRGWRICRDVDVLHPEKWTVFGKAPCRSM